MLINSHSHSYLEKRYQEQTGAVLVLSLIILAVLSVIGVSSMQSADTQRLQRAEVAHHTAILFEAAEAALRYAESTLLAPPSPYSNQDTLYSRAYKTTYKDAQACQHKPTPLVPLKDKMIDAWNRAQELEINQQEAYQLKTWQSESVKVPVQYDIDFLCFMPALMSKESSVQGAPLRYYPTYQITVLARDDNGVVRIALQSTYRLMTGIKKPEKAKGLRLSWRELALPQ